MMGPPKVPPNIFQRNFGVGSTPTGVPARQTIFPFVSVEEVIAEVLEYISVITVGTGLNCGVDDSAVVVAKLGRSVLRNDIKLPIASGEGVKPRRLSEAWLLSMPSNRKLLACSRFPLI